MKTNLTGTIVLAAIWCVAWTGLSRAAALNLDFSSTGGTLLDAQGQGTGFTTRLSGTGTALAASDPNLDINTATGKLTIRTGNNVGANQDFNGQAGLDTLEAVGIQLSSLGYTGTQDFTVTAVFDPLQGTNDFDQAGVFIGTDSATLTRAGHITFGGAGQEYFSGHTTGGTDNNGRFFGFGFNGADGMTVTISRVGGDWQYFIDGLAWHPNSGADGSGTLIDPNGANGSPNLDALSDLTVGVYAINVVNAISETVTLDSFSVNVPVPGDATGEGDVNLDDFELISDNLFNTVPAGTMGDVTLDGVVNYADFRLWKNNYVPAGSSALSGGEGVPEPSGIVLAVIALCGVVCGRRVQ